MRGLQAASALALMFGAAASGSSADGGDAAALSAEFETRANLYLALSLNGTAQLTIAGDSMRATLGFSGAIQADRSIYSAAINKFNALEPGFDFMAFVWVDT